MAKNQSTYTLKIDAELGNLQKTLNEAKTSLTSFLQSGNAPKGLEKAFEKISALLGQISDKTGKPLDLKGLTSTGKDLSTVQENFRAIIRLLGEFDDLSDDVKLSFLSVEEQKKVIAITDALKAYGAAAEESAKKVKLLEAAQKNLTKDEGKLGKAKKGVGEIEGKKIKKEADLAGEKQKLAALQGMEGADPQKVASYQAKIGKLEADLEVLNKQLKTANEELTSAQSAYDASAQAVTKLSNEVDRASKDSLRKLKEEANALGVSLDGLNGRNAAKQIEILTNRLEEFKNETVGGAKPAFDAIADGCSEAGKAVEKLGEDVAEASKSVVAMDEATAQRDAFEAKIKSFLGLQGAAQLMRAALRDAIQTITELDATMADMAVVTDLDIGDYWNQLPQYTQRANELGLAIGDVYKADTLFYQQGLKTNEVVAISTETMKMASIAGLDTAEATDRMTAALRGFNMELNEASAQNIADVYSELAAITAADVDEISTAMTKTASIASSAGMEFETTAAFLSQIIETTRESAETAGTAMKTVIARFQELKKSPDEIGEVDGEIVDANAIETALRSVGVSLRDAGGQFRELDDVFLELSGKWDTLDKNTQRYIATIAAGSRQQSRFIAMMSDYQRTTELVTAANNSAGASQEQFEKKADSLEFKINQLKNAWHEFTMGIMDSDLVKFGVDILTKFLEVVNKATDGIGKKGFGGELTKLASVFAIFKMGMKIFNKFEAPIMSLYKKVTKWAGIEGFNAGKAYTEAAERGAKAVISGTLDENENQNKESKQPTEKQQKKKEKRISALQASMMTKASGKGQQQVVFDEKQQAFENQEDEERIRKTSFAQKTASYLGFDKAIDSKNKATEARLAAEATAKQLVENNQNREALQLGIEKKQAEQIATHSRVQELQSTESDRVRKIEMLQNQAQFRPDKFSADQEKRLNKLQKEQAELNKLKQKEIDIAKDLDKDQKDLEKNTQDRAKLEEQFNTETETYLTNQDKMWKDIGSGISSAGEKIAGVGIAASMLGGVFDQLGLEGLGEAFSTVGQFATMFGTALSALGPVISMIGTIGSAVGAKLTAAGISTQLAWWWVVLIVAAIAALIAGIIALTSYLNNNSPDKKLENAAKAADAAAEAADNAAKAYEDLNSSLEELDNKYATMEGLVRGTDEWNKALQETNSAVLDLIEKYPELASLVENVNGQLKLDTASDEVQAIIKKYEASSTQARGVSLAAQQNVNAAKQTVNFSKLDAVQEVGNQRHRQSVLPTLTLGGSIANGVNVGKEIGGFGGVMAGIGVSLLGPLGTLISRPILEASSKTDEKLQKATENLAKSVEQGKTELEFDAMKEFLIQQGVAADEAKAMAKAFADDTEALREFGKSALETEAANKAYYTAMATNAQQMLNLGNYSQHEITQMNEAINAERMKAIEEEQKQKWGKEAKGSVDSEEYKNAKEDFATAQYGANARVDGNKIVNEKGETLREFENDEAWANAIAAAEATKEAAAAMEKVPAAIDKAAKALGRENNNNIVEKALTNADKLTKDELNTFKKSVEVDSKGKINAENSTLKALYNDNPEFKEIYGEYEDFIKSYQDIIDKQDEAWVEIEERAKNLDFNVDANGKSIISGMSTAAANTWTNLLTDVMPTGTTEGADAVNTALANLIAGKSQEEVDAIMSQIGSIDIMDAGAWDNLAYTLENMGLVVDSSDASLQAFIDKAKKATNAIEKINFSNFNQQINQTIELLKKAEDGARKYSEEEYQSFITANKGLKNEFIQIGDEYVYLGTAMEDLTDAIMQNTVAKLEEANFLLAAQVGMAGILEGRGGIDKNESVADQRTWLVDTVRAFADEGYDVKNLGIAGLDLDTEFSELDDKAVKEMVEKVLAFKGQKGTLEDQQAKQMRDANVAAYTLNDTAFNARMGFQGGEWADEHRDALRVQAIEAGVGDVILQSYANASKQYEDMMKQYEGMTFEDAEAAMSESDKAILDNFRLVSQNMVDMIHTVEENEKQKEELNALSPLAEKVASAIEKQRQSTIDKLSDVNDSINSANDLLISKIQEQIDADRQERENQKMKDNLSNMYAQQAYLGMDTSGANALSMINNEKAIEQAEQEYRDAMIDQAIQKLQDANEQAAQQRERQINLLQQQLDYEMQTGQIADQAAQIVRESINEVAAGQDVSQTQLNKYFREDIAELGGMEKQTAVTNWMDMIQAAIKKANTDEPENNSGTAVTGNTLDKSGGDNPGKSTITDEEKEGLKEQKLSSILQDAKAKAQMRFSGTSDDREGRKSGLQADREAYEKAGGDVLKFDQVVKDSKITTGSIDGLKTKGVSWWHGTWDTGEVEIDGESYKFTFDHTGHIASKQGELTDLVGGYPKDRWLAMRDSIPYIYWDGNWHEIDNNPEQGTDEQYKALQDAYKNKLNSLAKYRTGGLADFTGPAWLDGTKSRPEYVLNSTQTERFFSLVDILEGIDKKDSSNKPSGDNYFDINISVEKLENDYDVEQVAEKIRKMIYDDATYRNVNAINHIR